MNQYEFDFSRRRFLQQGTAALATVSLGGLVPQRALSQDAQPVIPGKDSRLIVHSPSPGEIETPLALLREHRLTPKSLLFVRNNQTLPEAKSLDSVPLAGWSLEFSGLVNRPFKIDAARLQDLEQVDREVILQCSGNGRSCFAAAAPVKGVPWQAGSMGNVVFSGVPLATALKHWGIGPQEAARFITAEGRDLPAKPGEADFEHSLPFAESWERSILALRMNGEPIPAVHGGPLRLITPGYYATMNVKWLIRLRFEAQETSNHHQSGRYRTPLRPIEPGADFEYRVDNSEPNWNMRIKSVIFAPLDGEKISAGPAALRGVAWNDGLAKIDQVQVSSDGQTWRSAKITAPSSPYAWYAWEATLPLAAGEQQLMVRAIDALGRSQPLDGAVQWNPAGYCYSAVHRVKVTVSA